jgi:hypothetical protein
MDVLAMLQLAVDEISKSLRIVWKIKLAHFVLLLVPIATVQK